MCYVLTPQLGNLDCIHLEIASALPMKNLKNLALLMLNFGLFRTHLSEILMFLGHMKEICTFFGHETYTQNEVHVSIFSKTQKLGLKHNEGWCQVTL